MAKISEMFFMDKVVMAGQELNNFSLGSVWLSFYGGALVAINRYNINEHKVEAFTIRVLNVDEKTPITVNLYKEWVKNADLMIGELEKEFTIPDDEWLPISPEEIHAKAVQWLGDQILSIVQDRLTGG